MKHRLIVSLGSNVPPPKSRLQYIESALKLIGSRIGRILETSGLYESATAYVENPALPSTWTLSPKEKIKEPSTLIATDTTEVKVCRVQPNLTPPHLNAVLLLETNIDDPEIVLKKLQSIEIELGRKRESAQSQQPQSNKDGDQNRWGYNDYKSSQSTVYETDKEECATTSFGTPTPSGYDPSKREIPFHKIRSIDIDMLLFDNLIWKSKSLTLPHPGLTDRNFILFPLRDVAPGIDIPKADTNQGNHTGRYEPRYKGKYELGDQESLASSQISPSVESCIQRNLNLKSLMLDPLHSRPIQVFGLRPSTLLAFGPGILPHIMGVLNVTPDSFSDGGVYNRNPIDRAKQMIAEGVDIIDVGGESTAPGRAEVPATEELRRVIPVIEGIRKFSDVPISVDTRKSEVLEASIIAGADLLNDVSGGIYDSRVFEVAARYQIAVILGHMKGTPEMMHTTAEYEDLIPEVAQELHDRIDAATKAGIPRWRIMVDVGLGFAKSSRHNIELLRNLEAIAERLPSGICQSIGFSRKHFLGDLANNRPAQDSVSGKSSVSLQLKHPEEVEKRDYAAIALLAGLAKKQLDETKKPIEQFVSKNGSCLALVRTHKVQESKIALRVISTLF